MRRVGVALAALAALVAAGVGVAGAQTTQLPPDPRPNVSDATLSVARLDGLASGAGAFAIASCPQGTRATGGGVGVTGPGPAADPAPTSPFTLQLSNPLAGGSTTTTNDGAATNEWFGAVTNTSGAPRDFRIFALCSRVTDAVVRVAPFTVARNQATAAAATCPANMRVVGGGVGTDGLPPGAGGAYTLLLSGPLDETGTTAGTEDGDVARSWYGAVRNDSAADEAFRVFAVCSRTSDAVVRVARIAGVPSLASGAAAAVCPAGRRVVGGGVNTSTGAAPAGADPMYFVQLNGPQDETGTTAATESGDVARRWFASIQNFTGSPQDFKVFALCESEPASAAGGGSGGARGGGGGRGGSAWPGSGRETGPRIRLSVSPGRATRTQRTTFTFTARVDDRRISRALVRFAGKRVFTSRRGRAVVRTSVTRRRVATASKAGYRTGSATVRIKRRSARATAARSRCVRAQVGGRRVCVRVGQRCSADRRPAYLRVGLDCVRRGGRRVLANATPAALRGGEYVALPSSGVPTLENALAAFDQTVADLPGVSPPRGAVGETQSGSAALRWLIEYREELTAAQRAAVAAALAPAPDAQTLDIAPDGTIAGEAPVAGASRNVRARAAQTSIEGLMQILREGAVRLRAHGLVLRHPVTVSFKPEPMGAMWAASGPFWHCRDTDDVCAAAKDWPNSCHVYVLPKLRAASLEIQIQILLHELTHCAQFESTSSFEQGSAVPGWVMDGTAEYASYVVAQEWVGHLPYTAWWDRWLRESEPSLFKREYSAVGFWFLLAQEGANVFSLIDPVVRAGGGGDSDAAYGVATRGVDPTYKNDWGPTLAMVPSLGGNWNLSGPGITHPLPKVRVVGNGANVTGEFDRKGAAVTGLLISADIVRITTSPGSTGRLRDAAGNERTTSPTMDFCARPGGCECPEGGGPTDLPKMASGLGYLGLADIASPGNYVVKGESLDDVCRKRTPQDRPGRGGTGGRGGGLEIRNLDTGLMGTITSGSCSVRGGAFVATGRGSGYRFRMRIAGARRAGSYVIPIGSGATFVTVSGPGGTYTSNRGVQGFPGGGSADLARVRVRVGKRTVTRWRISVGVTPLFVPGGDPAAAIIPAPGGLIC